jgi:hypothetical protein
LFLLASGVTLLARASHEDIRLDGYVTDTWCGVNRDTKAPTAECTKSCVKTQSAKYAFYNFADQKVYILNPQSLAEKYAGDKVTIWGTIDRATQAFATMRGPGEGQTITAHSISK